MVAHAQELRRPREPLAKLPSLTKPSFPAHLVVKFRDDMKVRASAGRLRSLKGADLALPDSVKTRRGLTFEPLINLPQATLDFLEKTAADRSGIDQPDLAGMMVVFGPDAAIEQAANELLALDELEWAQFSALDPDLPCVDIGNNTPDLFTQQAWRDDDGVRLNALSSCFGASAASGAGIQVADVEQDFLRGHEDLCRINEPIGQSSIGDAKHGLAVLGILGALDTPADPYGLIGAVPDAEFWFFSEFPTGGAITPCTRVTAIAGATAQLLEDGTSGDVQLFEIQTTIASNPAGDPRFGAPAEIVGDVFTLTKLATDAGIVVVEAAGNDTNDLDSAPFDTWRSWGDSGAIIVGGGSADGLHRYYIGSHGARVDVHAWADNVATLGPFGEIIWDQFNDSKQSYSLFSGTSSASAIVAGVSAAVQSIAKTQFVCSLPSSIEHRLKPLQLRNLLVSTGQPQGSLPNVVFNHIGPIPDALAAAGELMILGIADNNTNGIEDICDIWSGVAKDCNGNLVIDSIDISAGVVTDCDTNGVDDNCDSLGACCQSVAPPFPPTYSCSATTSGRCCQQGGNFAGAGTKCGTTDCGALPN